MDKAEQFIKDYTNHCSNLLVFAKGDKEYDYAPWLTPEQALRAVEIAREEVIEALRLEYEKGRADVIVEIEKCYEKAITAEAQAYLIKDLLDRLKTKKQV